MKNCLVLGAGRSGTSMLAGTIGAAGYFMGASLLPGNEANPRGFFEDLEIIAINEAILAQVAPSRPPSDPEGPRPFTSDDKWRWLATVDVGVPVSCSPALAGRIKAWTAKIPFCFKDPRFCYTLPAWRPFLRDTVYVCVFREPERTAQSIVKFCRDCQDLAVVDKGMDLAQALRVWTSMYRHILEEHRHVGDWLFVHYDQLLDGSAIPRLEELLGVGVDARFPDALLKRSPREGPVGPEALAVYERMCELANWPH